MSFRKIKLKIKKENLQEIVEALTKDNEVELVLNVEENKKNFGYLSSTAGILDWDFVDSETNDSRLVESKEEKPEIKTKGKKLEDIEIKDFNKLAWIVELYWSIGKGGWQQDDFYTRIDIEAEKYIKNPNSIISGLNHLMVKTLIEYYYDDSNVEIGITDTINKLKEKSQRIFQCSTISEVTKLLYGEK